MGLLDKVETTDTKVKKATPVVAKEAKPVPKKEKKPKKRRSLRKRNLVHKDFLMNLKSLLN